MGVSGGCGRKGEGKGEKRKEDPPASQEHKRKIINVFRPLWQIVFWPRPILWSPRLISVENVQLEGGMVASEFLIWIRTISYRTACQHLFQIWDITQMMGCEMRGPWGGIEGLRIESHCRPFPSSASWRVRQSFPSYFDPYYQHQDPSSNLFQMEQGREEWIQEDSPLCPRSNTSHRM